MEHRRDFGDAAPAEEQMLQSSLKEMLRIGLECERALHTTAVNVAFLLSLANPSQSVAASTRESCCDNTPASLRSSWALLPEKVLRELRASIMRYSGGGAEQGGAHHLPDCAVKDAMKLAMSISGEGGLAMKKERGGRGDTAFDDEPVQSTTLANDVNVVQKSKVHSSFDNALNIVEIK